MSQRRDENFDLDLIDLEHAIQGMLIDFVNKHGCRIESVEADTRRFGNLAVEIHVAEDKGRP